jgi:prepilin-type processing-associated H-X9-DG protein
MKNPKPMNNSSKQNLAFTVIELLVVLATLGICAVMVMPALARTGPSVARLNCAANLKQIGLAFQNWRNAHVRLYPMNAYNASGGPPGLIAGQTIAASANASAAANAATVEYAVFGVMSNELSTPKICVCPSDERSPHTNFTMSVAGNAGAQVAQPAAAGSVSDPAPAYFNNFKLSYFLGVNARDSNPQMILAGDRNIWGYLGNTTTPPNVNGYGNANSTEFAMGTNWGTGTVTFPAWSPSKMHQGKGNVLLADGSVQQLDSVHLRQQLSATGDTTSTPGPNTLLFP